MNKLWGYATFTDSFPIRTAPGDAPADPATAGSPVISLKYALDEAADIVTAVARPPASCGATVFVIVMMSEVGSMVTVNTAAVVEKGAVEEAMSFKDV